MKKIIIALIVLVIVGGIVYALSVNKKVGVIPTYPEGVMVLDEATTTPSTTDRQVSGTVTNVNTDQVAVDGPARVTIADASGTSYVVAVPSMGINMCAAQPNIADVYQLKAGDKVEARGSVGPEGIIVPCESAEHYLRVMVQ